MPRSIHFQAILDALGSLRAAVDQAEENWSRPATHANRDAWWPRGELMSRHRRPRERRSRGWGAVARVRRREDDSRDDDSGRRD